MRNDLLTSAARPRCSRVPCDTRGLLAHVVRRAIVPRAALAVAVVLTAAAALAQAPLDVLRVWHPNTLAFAAPFKLIGGSGVLADYAKSIEISEWTTPDILRSVLVNRGSEVTAVPTYVGANLANRGVDVKMAAVLVWGLLWMIGPDGAAPEWESLRG